MPSVTYDQNTNSISGSFEKIGREEIGKQLQASKSLFDKAKTPSCKKALEQLIPLLEGKDITHSDLFHLNEIYKDLIQSLDKEPDLDHSLVYKALGLDKEQAELNDASNLDDLKNKIAEFDKEKLLKMLYFSKISYGDGESKLEKDRFKTRKQFKSENYKIIKFYENEFIQDEYCSDNDYKLEKCDVDYALKANNSCTRDAGCIFIGDDGEVTIAYHGTRDNNDNKHDLDAFLTELKFSDKKIGDVHRGFYSLFKRSWPNVHKILQGYANDEKLAIKDLKINVTGHSMGGALASIAALCLNKTEGAENVHVATFGSPRVLYQDAAKVYSKCLGEKTIRVACQSDPVPCVPFGGGGLYYKHVGKPLKLETGKTINCLSLSDHSLSKYIGFINDIEQENFKSGNDVSKYFLLAFTTGLLCSNFPKDVHSSNDKEFFEKVKKENKDIKLSAIPLYILTLEKELKQVEQERDKLTAQVIQLNQEKSQLQRELNGTQQGLDEKISEVTTLTEERGQLTSKVDALTENLENKSKELDNVKEKLTQEQQKACELGDQVTKLAKELEGTKAQLEQGNDNLASQVGKLEKTKAELAKKKEELTEKEKKLQQGLDEKTTEVTVLAKERDQLLSENNRLTKEKDLDLGNENKKLSGVFYKLCQTAFLVQLNFQSARKEDIKLRYS